MSTGIRMGKSRSSKYEIKSSVTDNTIEGHDELFEFLNDDQGFESLFYKSSIPKALSNINSKKFIAVNSAWETFTGYKNKEATNVTAYDLNLVGEEEGQYIREILEKKHSLKSFEAELLPKSGIRTNALFSFERITIGKNDYILSEILDISELRRSKDLLKAEKDFSQNLLASLQEGLSVINLQGTHISVNAAFCEMTGFTKEELIGIQPPYPYWPPEEYENINVAFQNTLKGQIKKNINLIFKRKNEERFPVSLAVSSLKDSEGNTIAFFSTIKDITQQLRAEEELRLAKEYSEELVTSLRQGLVVMNVEGEIIDVNPAYSSITGFKREELLGATAPFPFWPPESYEEIQKCLVRTLAGEVGNFEFLFMRKNGERFMASLATSSIKNNEGKVMAFFVTIDDITDKINAQAEIRRAKEFSENLLASMDEGLLVVSIEDGKLTKVNPSFCKMTGYTEKELLASKAPFPFWAPECYDTCFSHYENLIKAEYHNYYETVYKRKNEERFPVQLISSQIKDEEGKVVAILATIQDITERKAVQRELNSLNIELSTAVTELKELKIQLQNENVYLRDELDLVFNFEEMVYGSAAFSDVLSNVEKVAPTDATVLLLGDTGTGKELLARAVHNISVRKDKPLIKVNCAAIPRELIESELFGHTKGSFTGAVRDKIGKVELAHGGTLFLDEIGELPLDMQPKLLRFLQEGEIEKIGENTTRKLNVRIIAATNRNLKKEVAKKRFREDLYFRLNVFPIKIPPLHKRLEDIPLLVEHFVNKFGKIYRKEIKYISDKAMIEMQQYKWPGNIRELENLIERAVILSNGEYLQLPQFDISDQTSNRPITITNLSLDEAQRIHILKVLEKCDWKIDGNKGAALFLKIKPSTLRDRMKKLKIKRPD
ncbi:PAS domain S-box-containing protein [Ulvibacter sp. MAR_2010_11]|uniref:PAS domain S-box protein n=1 Tax=Ulvibacter sp. MAR_2010_11 TaxID=1250229 RepID=UPI000C2BD12A|nr:PAS domain S-box protein [Ulvibacter sp. MAR_2010_11]PKA82604.1 PAS domain S-box-containing protein [Ulvibacter sp. MAR_2010_11]